MEFTAESLKEIGVFFSTQEETNAFIDFVTSEFELRVGDAICKSVNNDFLLIAQFNKINDDEGERLWLKRYCPNFEEIIAEVHKELVNELKENKEAIMS